MNDLIKTEPTQVLTTLRNTIAPGLTDAEFQLFCETCRATGLNPVTKEIWAIKAGGRLQIMAGLNGFLKIANSHPQFDGMEVDIKTDEKGAPVAATCKVYRKDRKFPSSCTVLMNEFRGSTPIWAKMPSVMLAKVAKSHAIREAFSLELAGLYTPEEMPEQYAPPRAELKTEVEVINEVTGEIVEAEPVKKAVKGKQQSVLKATYYDIGAIEDEEKRAAAEKYLTERGAKEVEHGVFKSLIRLDKLTSIIIENYDEK